MYASIWKRFWAFMIDLTVFVILFILLAQLLNEFTVSLLLLVIIWLYYAALESSPWQASLGKRLVGLKVVDKHGHRLTFYKATKRLLVRLGTNIAFYIGFFTAAFDQHKETLHDRLSKSIVINEDTEFNPDNYSDPEDNALTLVTVTSVLLAFIFVAGLIWCVVLPQYQRIGDRVNAARMIENLQLAADNRPARMAAAGKNHSEIWLKSYTGCTNDSRNPLTLNCNGYKMTLHENGISAVSRLANWEIYTLFKSYQTGSITCSGDGYASEKFCASLTLP